MVRTVPMMIQVDGRTRVPLGRVAETMCHDTGPRDRRRQHGDAEPRSKGVATAATSRSADPPVYRPSRRDPPHPDEQDAPKPQTEALLMPSFANCTTVTVRRAFSRPIMRVPAATRSFATDIVPYLPRPSPMSGPSSLLSMRRGHQDLFSSRPLLVHPGRERHCFSATLTVRLVARERRSINPRTAAQLPLRCMIFRRLRRSRRACSSRSRPWGDRNDCTASSTSMRGSRYVCRHPCCGGCTSGSSRYQLSVSRFAGAP